MLFLLVDRGTMKKIFFRVDGNSKVATGHVMRCISYAMFFKANGCDCFFITADDYMHEVIRQKGFFALSLCSAYDKMQDEVDSFRKLIKAQKPALVIIDSYFVTENYLTEISKLVKTIYIDDLNSFDYPVNAILNYSIYADKINYDDTNKRLFLGMEYLALRQEFVSLKPIEIKKQIKNVFITTGGSDVLSFTKDFLQNQSTLNMFGELNYHVILGNFFNSQDKQFLFDLQKKHQNVTIYQNIANMGEVMSKCDIAISAGGSTLYELAYLGVPTIALITAENQRLNVETFAEKSVLMFGGDTKEKFVPTVIKLLQECTYEKRLIMAQNALACYKNDKKLNLISLI